METRACVFIWFVVIECVVLDFVKLISLKKSKINFQNNSISYKNFIFFLVETDK